MDRNALLDHLAQEMDHWPAPGSLPDIAPIKGTWKCRGKWRCYAMGDNRPIEKSDWLLRRVALLNATENDTEVFNPRHSAPWFLQQGLAHMEDRAKTYDKQGVGGERSMQATVNAFVAITGDGQIDTAERGWMFMVLLKMTRSQQGQFKADNYEDAAAYCGLMGESAAAERGNYESH